MERKVTPEEYSLRYIIPCFNNFVHRKILDKKTALDLEKMLLEHKQVPRKYIESHFPDYVRRLKELAREMGMGEENYWSLPVMREYWFVAHNKFIDAGDGEYANAGPSWKELCKTHVSKVIGREEVDVDGEKKNILIVRYDNKERRVLDRYVPEAKPGDTVNIHVAYVCEKI